MQAALKTPSGTVPYSAIFIDACLSDFTFAMQRCVTSIDRSHVDLCTECIAKLFQNSINKNPSLACLSVRTAFDLYLTVQNFPLKSQVVMSAINIPSMVQIVRLHGLVPVAWDVDPENLAPDPTGLAQLINDRTVAVVLAHIFGRRCDVTPIVGICRDRNVRFIEDCAEIFFGFEYLGHPDADLSLFSFGVLKNSTCFGGAVAKIRCEDTKLAMKKLHCLYPTVPSAEYLKKVCKYAVLAIGLNVPFVATVGVTFFRAISVNYKQCAVGMLRAFPGDLLTSIRRQPCHAMLQLMLKRLKRVHGLKSEFEMARQKGHFVADKLINCPMIRIPGLKAKCVNFWLYPIFVNADPARFAQLLNSLGVDAFTKASQLSLVDEPGFSNEKDSTPKARFLHNLVYLPVHKNVPFPVLDRICAAVLFCSQKLRSFGLLFSFKRILSTARPNPSLKSAYPPMDVDELAANLSCSASVHEPGVYASSSPHPRFSQYKNSGWKKNSQEKRRSEILERQKDLRFERVQAARHSLDSAESVNLADNTKSDKKNWHGNPRIHRQFADQLMLSEWLVDVPEKFAVDWLMVPVPVGKRSLVVASGGITKCFSKTGYRRCEFRSQLPGGSSADHRGETWLDCIFGTDSTIFVLDGIYLNIQDIGQGERIFRHFMLKSLFDEHTELTQVSSSNQFRFVLLPQYSCDVKSIEEAINLDSNFELDGLLFYCNGAYYEPGLTPLVGWLKPFMLDEILNVKNLPAKFAAPVTDGETPHSTTTAEFIEIFNAAESRRFEHVNKVKEEKVDALEVDTIQ